MIATTPTVDTPYRWISKHVIADLVPLQKATPEGVSLYLITCIAAYKLFDAVEQVLAGGANPVQLFHPEKWHPRDKILREAYQHKQTHRFCPWSATHVAALKQYEDLLALSEGRGNVAEITQRHEKYRVAQQRRENYADA